MWSPARAPSIPRHASRRSGHSPPPPAMRWPRLPSPRRLRIRRPPLRTAFRSRRLPESSSSPHLRQRPFRRGPRASLRRRPWLRLARAGSRAVLGGAHLERSGARRLGVLPDGLHLRRRLAQRARRRAPDLVSGPRIPGDGRARLHRHRLSHARPPPSAPAISRTCASERMFRGEDGCRRDRGVHVSRCRRGHGIRLDSSSIPSVVGGWPRDPYRRVGPGSTG